MQELTLGQVQRISSVRAQPHTGHPYHPPPVQETMAEEGAEETVKARGQGGPE